MPDRPLDLSQCLLPQSVERLHIESLPEVGESCVVIARYRDEGDEQSHFDFTLYGEDHRVLLDAAGYPAVVISGKRGPQMTPQHACLIDVLDLHTCDALPPTSDWLTDAEQEECARWRNPGRRRDWLGGRWLLKTRIQQLLPERGFRQSPAALRDIEILSCDGIGRRGPPRASLAGQWLPWQNSIAHHDGRICAAISTTPAVRLGIDVVPEHLPLAIASADWLTPTEHDWLRRSTDPELAATLWSIKESVYKAMNCGEAFTPRQIDVRPAGGRDFDWTYHGQRRTDADSLQIDHWCGCILTVASVVESTGRRRADDD